MDIVTCSDNMLLKNMLKIYVIPIKCVVYRTKDAEDDSVSSDPELQAGWLSLVRVVVEAG